MTQPDTREPISTVQAPAPTGNYPHARWVGDLLFLSGLGPRNKSTGDVPGNVTDAGGKLQDYDFKAQVHAVMENTQQVLKACGLGLDDLVDVTVFLTDMSRDFASMNRLWGEYFPDHAPCRTTVEVGALPTPIAIELKCLAARGHRQGEHPA